MQGQCFHQGAPALLDECLDVCLSVRKSFHQSGADFTTDHIDVGTTVDDFLDSAELWNVHDERDARLFT